MIFYTLRNKNTGLYWAGAKGTYSTPNGAWRKTPKMYSRGALVQSLNAHGPLEDHPFIIALDAQNPLEKEKGPIDTYYLSRHARKITWINYVNDRGGILSCLPEHYELKEFEA